MKGKLATIKEFLMVMNKHGIRGKLSLALCVLALLYFVLPFDFVPDIAFGPGQLDDLFFLISSALVAWNTYRKPLADEKDDKR